MGTDEFPDRLRKLIADTVRTKALGTGKTVVMLFGGLSCSGYSKGAVAWRHEGEIDITNRLTVPEVIKVLQGTYTCR